MSKFREFGISAEAAFLLKKDFSFQNCKDFVAQYGRYGDPEPIHVIEYAALEQAEAKIKELEAKLSFAVEVLEKYVDVSLYLGTYPEQYVAKEALEKLRGPNE